MNILLSILSCCTLLIIIFYLFLRKKDDNLLLISIKEYGTKGNGKQLKQNDKVLSQKIVHKEVSFYSYLSSLIICFLLGSIAIFKIINNDLDWTLLPNALSIAGGCAATVAFKKLHDKCSKELKSFK